MFDEVLEKVKIENREVIEATLVMCSEDIRKLIELAEITFEGGGRLFVFGNGGSASDALHLEA
ncbi:MAG TPA: phosphoheptose isomerase, partial [Firmicutes bacterium]|nr:phosphoheptose isomerase [Bacillota bacterium]